MRSTVSKRLWQPDLIVWNLLLLFGLGTFILLFAFDTYPRFWFDEGYKANAAYTLAHQGIYGTYTIAGFVPFDPGISSGPVDVLASALSFRLLGASVTSARLPSVFFTLAALAGLYRIAAYLYDQRAALFIVLAVMASPTIQDTGFMLVGRQMLGEPAALGMIALGIGLWFHAWVTGRWRTALLAGLLIGLGLLSKTQIAIALLPATALIGLARSLQRRSLWFELLPTATAVGVIALWMLTGRLLTPPDIAAENSRMLLDAIRTNLITGLWGSQLTESSWLMIAVMSIGFISGLYSWYRQGILPKDNIGWANAALTLLVGLTIIWFALFSVGWPRYAYTGLIFSQLLTGQRLWEWFTRLLPARVYAGGIAALSFLALLINLAPALNAPPKADAEVVGDFIRNYIPISAVIETWEWELDALSGHPGFNHPHQAYLFEAIRQFSHQRQAFDLGYDMLQADPDYLITGPFSDWTKIYDPNTIEAHFTPLAQIGVYRVFQRRT